MPMFVQFRVSATFLVLLIFSIATARGQSWRDSLELNFDDGNGKSMPYRLFVPPGHDLPGAEYPLVLFLHRGAFVGTDNRLQVSDHISGLIQATQGEKYPAFLLAPQTPVAWWYESVRELPMQIVESIEQEYQIDANRIYVTGTSLGGFGTPDIVTRNPNRFAAAIPMSAGLLPDPKDFEFGENLPETFPAIDLNAMADVPFWIFHGEDDEVIPAQWSRNLASELEAAGGEVHYTELPGGANHSGIWTGVYRDRDDELYPWLFSQSQSEFSITGDVNRNQILDVGDINLLTSVIIDDRNTEPRFDLNQDDNVDLLDRNHWVTDIRGTYFGDSNLDGEFNSSDFVLVFQAGEFEDGVVGNSTWATGDWNGDADFDFGDFVAAFQEGGYEQGPKVLAVAVPEPNTSSMLIIVLVTSAIRHILPGTNRSVLVDK